VTQSRSGCFYTHPEWLLESRRSIRSVLRELTHGFSDKPSRTVRAAASFELDGEPTAVRNRSDSIKITVVTVGIAYF